jgi:3',5'-cyclic AMP phosphodiesterase CpdA
LRKVLHITDVHFGRGHQPDRSTAIVRLARARCPDLVVFSGDLTKRAKPSQFREARRFVSALGAPTIAVPGNHDVPLFRVWERVLTPYGAYRKHYAAELEPTWEDGELRVFGVNTAFGWTFTGGRVKRRRIRQLERRLAEGADGRFTIVVLHHPVIPVPGYGSDEVLRNAASVARALSKGGVDLVLSGHVHLSHLGYTPVVDSSKERAVPVLFSGTASCGRGRGPDAGRNTVHWLEIDQDGVEIERLEWRGSLPPGNDAAEGGFSTCDTLSLPRGGSAG